MVNIRQTGTCSTEFIYSFIKFTVSRSKIKVKTISRGLILIWKIASHFQ